MAPKDKLASPNTKNTPVAKVVTPVKKKANPASTSPMVNLSPYNNPPKVKANPLEKKQRVHNIIPLQYPDKTPYGWAFEHFYDAKEFLKGLCNRKNESTYLGEEEFKPFSNLTVHWVKHSALGDNLWVIHIDAQTNDDEKAFPIQCHALFANKIARGLLQQLVWPKQKVEVDKSIIMDSSNESELTMIIESGNKDVTEVIIGQSILPGNSELESLI
jgi:hypothetical protein